MTFHEFDRATDRLAHHLLTLRLARGSHVGALLPNGIEVVVASTVPRQPDVGQPLLDRTGLQLDEIDLFEVNEAFAFVVLAWQRELGLPDLDRVHPNGGAIALGHPLGATGAVLLTKAVHELERRGSKRAIVTMCCSGGLGTGTMIERC